MPNVEEFEILVVGSGDARKYLAVGDGQGESPRLVAKW